MPDETKRFRASTEILYGINSLSLLAQEAKKLGISKPIFVTDPGPKEAGVLEAAFQSLREAKIPFVVFDKVPQNPYPDSVIEASFRILPARRSIAIRRYRASLFPAPPVPAPKYPRLVEESGARPSPQN